MTGVVVYVTGQPSAGKSTFAERAQRALRDRHVSVCILDGDAVRASLSPPVGYTPAERGNFYRTLANLAALLARQGLVVLVPATANRRAFRDEARAAAPAFLEVWLDTPPEECARRDTKGLYAASRAGAVTGMPGADEPYEPPVRPDIVAHGGDDQRAVVELCAAVMRDRAAAAR